MTTYTFTIDDTTVDGKKVLEQLQLSKVVKNLKAIKNRYTRQQLSVPELTETEEKEIFLRTSRINASKIIEKYL